MSSKLIRISALLLSLAACSGHESKATASSDSQGSGSTVRADGSQTPQPVTDPQGKKYYPVTLCGGVYATTDDVATAEYVFKNNSLVVNLQTTPTTDPLVLEQLHMLPSIHKYGGADGCVSGFNLPVNQDGTLIFKVEGGGISIAGGGFSVSN